MFIGISLALTAGGSGVDPLAPGAITLVGTTPTNDTTPPLTIGWPATVAEGWDLVIDEISTATNYITHTLTAQDIIDIGNEVPLSFSGASAIAAGTRTFRGHLDNAGHLGPDSDDEVIVIDTTAPTVSTFSPADNATDVAVDATLVVTFSETVELGASGTITLKKTSDNSTVDSWDVSVDEGSAAGQLEVLSSTQLNLHLTTNLPAGTEVYGIWDAGVVKDLAGNNVAALSVTTTWSFTTATAFSYEDAGIAVQTTNGTTSTFTGKAIGTAATGRLLLIFVVGHTAGGNPGLSGLTVDGNTAGAAVASLTSADYAIGVFKYALDAGTTANIVASWNGVTVGRAECAVVALYGANATETDTAVAISAVGTSITATIDVPTGGAAFAMESHVNVNATSWSGTDTTQLTGTAAAEATISASTAVNSVAGAGKSMTATWSGSVIRAIVAAAYGP